MAAEGLRTMDRGLLSSEAGQPYLLCVAQCLETNNWRRRVASNQRFNRPSRRVVRDQWQVVPDLRALMSRDGRAGHRHGSHRVLTEVEGAAVVVGVVHRRCQ